MTYHELTAMIDAAREAGVTFDTVMMRPTEAERIGEEVRTWTPRPVSALATLVERLAMRGVRLKLSTKVKAGEVLIYDGEE